MWPPLLLLIVALGQASKETLHVVDLSQVVCPKPQSSNPNAPVLPDYNLGIEQTTSMDMDSPYIVSFMRASKQAMSISFKILDYNGDTVVSDTTVQLEDLSTSVPSSCTCTSPTIPQEVESKYGQSYGTSCPAWDNANCGQLWGDLSVGSWCCRPWCYASQDCPDAYRSEAIPGQYFSYAACDTVSPASPCTWTSVAEQNDPCKCKNSASVFSTAMNATFTSDYGATCGTWDTQNCDINYRPDQVDTWCCKSWCYVDKECSTAKQSLNPGMEGLLFWSDNVCPDDPLLVSQCPYKPKPNITAGSTACACLDVSMPTYDLLKAGLDSTYSDYGRQCAPHDATICETTYPNAAHDMWCCMSWCWVDSSCPHARASTQWPGKFFSTTGCEMDADVVSSCKYSRVCECRGSLPAGTLPAGFSSSYGSSCSAWDATGCKATWSADSDSQWHTQSDHEWCCDAWCYVDNACPIAKLSWLGTGYYFSYETCDDPSTNYDEPSDSCISTRRRALRRLGQMIAESLDEVDPDESEERRLSARRRIGESARRRRTATSTARRRRSPPAPPTTARRRAPSKPSAASRRRRATPTTPRRRAVRRRTPPPTPPVVSNSRRRSTGIGGTHTMTPRRRRAPTTTLSPRRRATPSPTTTPSPSPTVSPRRRATTTTPSPSPTVSPRRRAATTTPSPSPTVSPRRRAATPTPSPSPSPSPSPPTTRRRRSTPYGYNSKNDMMNNHGGTMPHQTNYGYSGSDAVSANSNTNVAIYAAGAAVAAAVVGAGAAYAYNSMYGDAYSDHRRRRANSFETPDLCTVTAAGSRNGDFMECQKCYDHYGISSCPSASSCNTPTGCSYTTPQSLSRDDLAATGFVPEGYTFPLRVIFTSVTGAGIVTDPLSGGLCPPTTAAEADYVERFNKTMSFKPELFLVLTKQSALRQAEPCERDTLTTCSFYSCSPERSVCENEVCLCDLGYCWNGYECLAQGVASAASNQAFHFLIFLPLLLRRVLHL